MESNKRRLSIDYTYLQRRSSIDYCKISRGDTLDKQWNTFLIAIGSD